MADSDWMELADAIAQLRAQLSKARSEALGQDILFNLGKAEIELTMEVRYDVGGGGGFKFGIVTLEGKGSRSSSTAHHLRLELMPHDATGAEIDVRSQVQSLPDR